MRKVRENILVTAGDLSIFTANKPVFTTTGLNGILDQQLVIYDEATGISQGPGVVATTVDRLVIAVGHDLNGNGVADVLRKPFGDKIYGYSIQAATAEPPRCGTPEIHDLYYNCVHCHEQFSMNITVEDDLTQNQYPYNRPSLYTFTVDTGCCACDSCDTGIDSVKLSCLLRDQINGTVGSTDATKQSTFTQLAKKKKEYPFYAHVLYGGHDRASQDWCLTTVADTCGDCVDVDAIASIRFTHPVDGVTTVDFVNTISPSDGAKTLIGQLDGLITQIDTALDGLGSAALTSGLEGDGRPCCSFQLQINSCLPDVDLLDEGGTPIASCANSDPFASIATENDCPTCTEPGAGAYVPVAGLRIIAKAVDVDCNCDTAPDTPRGYLGRNIAIHPINGFACGSTYQRQVQAAVLPEGTGYEWQTREVNAANGGSGRNHNPWSRDPHGRWGNPLKEGRGHSAKSKCNELYCIYAIEHSIPNTDFGIHGEKSGARGTTFVLIPSSDSTTRAEFEAIINPYLASSPGPNKMNVLCGQDQDQIEQVVDPQSGLITTPEHPNPGGGQIL